MAGVLVSLGLAGVVGFVAFVNIVGQGDSIAPPPPAQTRPGVEEAASASSAATPLEITEARLTDTVDAVTGEPGSSIDVFRIGEPVQLWLSFEAGDAAVPVTAVWFRGDNQVARLTTPLPDAASQMVFPLPQLAGDRPGPYRVEVRSHGDVLAAESFEVTNG